uniref:Uncharacterized protein mibV n=1 Tax=Microbispora corallina TaxID=83302 RepID=E2IHC2_9ACTN|nr:hypothetical protein [Microbispora corallina]
MTTATTTGPTGRETLLAGAVSWLAARLRWFDPEQWARHLQPRGFAPSALLELLIICRNLNSVYGHPRPPDPEDGSRGSGVRTTGAAGPAVELIGRALDLAEEVVGRPGFGAALYRGDAAFPHHVWLIALLAEGGRPVEPWPAVAQRVIDAGCAEPIRPGRPTAARLEARYVFDLAGLRHGLPAMDELAGRTALGPGADPLHLTDADLYVITHMLFYLTDFGRRPFSADEAEGRRVRGLVEVLLGRQLAVGDLDLAAELLACAGLTGADDRLSGCAWNRLTAARRPDGSVPSPLFRQAALDRLSGEKAEAYAFGTCYHTTLAMVLAATLTDGADA